MATQTEWQKFNELLADGGPIYTETSLEDFIVKPWNAFSSLSFLLPAILWGWRCRNNLKANLFLLGCCLLLSAGGIGSTLFHAFRKFPILLWLDVFPILLLTLLVSVFFWIKTLPSKWLVLPVMVPFIAFRYWIFETQSSHTAINIGYFITGVLIFLPLLLLLLKTRFNYWGYLLIAMAALGVALVFRTIDAWNPPLMSIGTHWLWHLFCALGAHYLGAYIYTLEPSNFIREEKR